MGLDPPTGDRLQVTGVIAQSSSSPDGPGRCLCAVPAAVIDELGRALHGSRFDSDLPLFVHHGVPLRVPEAGRAIDSRCLSSFAPNWRERLGSTGAQDLVRRTQGRAHAQLGMRGSRLKGAS